MIEEISTRCARPQLSRQSLQNVARGDEEFIFDNEVINSTTYRRALQAAQRRGAATGRR